MSATCLFCQIASGTVIGANRIVEFPHSVAVLHFNQSFRGRSILIAKEHCTDMPALPRAAYAELCEELREFSRALQRSLRPDRINYANFGNVMAHLRWHVIPSYRHDPRWGRPPTFDDDRSRSSDEPYENLASVIRGAIRGRGTDL
ncbi:MAG: HIT family protein [Hyphomicrobiales bacterium]